MLKEKILPSVKIPADMKEVKITIIGLDGSGKTTFLNQLMDESDRIALISPTVTVNEKIFYKNINQKITFIDVPGQKALRNLTWKPNLIGINGLVC